jgi:CheY-like chemotaxis protein
MLLTILIVDDEEIVRKMLRVLLTSENTNCLEAKDGTEAC